MSEKILKGVALCRRRSETDYDKVKDSFVPKKGEICLVDTALYGLRAKIGDGATNFGNLQYSDNENSIVLLGYYFNNEFYNDSTYTIALEKNEKHLYVDKNARGALYIWNGNEYASVSPEATEDVAGIMKLYQSHGFASDGTMSQKIITEGINSIKLELDEVDAECLVLDLPWD